MTGGYKYNEGHVTESITTTQYGTIIFPAGRIVTTARRMTSASGGVPMILSCANGQTIGLYYIAAGGAMTAFAGNTSYDIDYVYLEKVT